MSPEKHNSIRILLVDDEADLVEFMARLLLKKGFTVTATADGFEALAAVQTQVFDVAIVDLRMPHMDGIEVLENIRAIQPYLEVIMLTGHGSIDSALEAGRLCAFRYLLKPYRIEELLEQIQEAYEQRDARLDADYEAEMAQIMTPGHTSMDILAKGEELRRKYERD